MCCLSNLYRFSISSRAHITIARYIWFQLISPYSKFRSSIDFMNFRCHSSNVAHFGACNENISTLMMSRTMTSRVACGKYSLMVCSAYTPKMSSGTLVRAWYSWSDNAGLSFENIFLRISSRIVLDWSFAFFASLSFSDNFAQPLFQVSYRASSSSSELRMWAQAKSELVRSCC